MANLNDVLQGLVNLNSKMANNINNLLDSIGEGFLDVGELKVENGMLSLQGATILVNGSNILVENLSTTFAGNKICFLEYKADKSIALKVLSVVDANFNYDLSQLSATSKHFEIARQYNGVLEDRRVASMASKDNTIVGALNGALKAIDYDNEMDLEINMDILSRVSAVESDIVDLDTKKADKTYVDEAVANVDIDGVVTAVNVGEVEDIENPYLTREDLEEALQGVDLTEYQKVSDNNLSTSNKTIVGAINELFQSANNGKELIASSIGEPLDASDTFQAMSNDINGLLSQFKANMMSSGVTVEANDKFKQLIEKIKGLTEGEGNKGIRFVSGVTTEFIDKEHLYTVYEDGVGTDNFVNYKSVEVELDFVPSFILTYSKYTTKAIGISSDYYDVAFYDNLATFKTYLCPFNEETDVTPNDSQRFNHLSEGNKYYLPVISNDSFGSLLSLTTIENTYYAIGVGEEDTTLRDSLASILQEKGVEVTEEDDMASLISKIETMKSGGYNIEVVSELPTKADDYQIAILDPNTDAHIYIDTIESPSALNMYSFKDGDIYVRNITSIDIPGVHRTKILTQNITKSYTIQSILKYNSGSFSYLGDSVYEYLDNKWNLIFGNVLNIYRDNVLVNEVNFTRFSSSSGTSVYESVTAEQYQVTLNKPTSTGLACSTYVPIDVTNYNKLVFELKSCTFSSVSGDFYVGVRKDQTGTGFDKSTFIANASNYQPGVYIVDVSDLTGSYYLGIGAPAYKHSCTTLKFNFSAIYLTV